MGGNKVFASIITIGDELLIGQTIDTNSAWMAQELNKIGIWVHRRVAVGDVWEEIWNTLNAESEKSEVILITGGLGPTADDITKPLLCKYFDGKLVIDEGALENVKSIFERLKRPLLERNLKQAEVPNTCKVIPNHRGTAPGMWFEKNQRVYVSMPGVPHEMKGMMENDVLIKLKDFFTLPLVYHRTLITAGIGESFLAERLKDFETALPTAIKMAYLPNYGMVKIRLTATGEAEVIKPLVDHTFQTLQSIIKDVLVATEDLSMQKIVSKLLLEKKLQLGIAESCTGGQISHLITAMPGSSEFFRGSIVSYANGVKKDLLGVNAETLEKFGAVSRETAEEMTRGAIQSLGTDVAVVTTGIMGPTGGSEDKPVGTIWIGVGNKEKTEVQSFHFRFDRQRNIELSANAALNMLRKFILENW